MAEHQPTPPITAVTVKDKLDRYLAAVLALEASHADAAASQAQQRAVTMGGEANANSGGA